jgi:hypothetical protein
MAYLVMLGEEISKPITPREAELEYLPSQYLCEFMKSLGYEGIVYNSSLSDGDNYALFIDDATTLVDLKEYEILNSDVDFEEIT